MLCITNMNELKKPSILIFLTPFFAIFFSWIAFVWITGGHILCPTTVDWLLKGPFHDPIQHWLGWQFFRYSPLFQWPMGSNPDFGIYNSIVFTDSIPLLAFIFKPVSFILPRVFQYTGIWILICFSLQSFFAWKLLSLLTKDKVLPLIGSLFFTIAPPYLFRLHCHYALVGHWVLLVGIYLYFIKNFSSKRWISLLGMTTLIHAYLLVMVFGLWCADLVQSRTREQMSVLKIGIHFILTCLWIIVLMWTLGYFMVGSSFQTSGGFGFYHMNLLSLINPNGEWSHWSRLLPALKGGGGDYEGFNYLGLGMIGLGCIAIHLVYQQFKRGYRIKITPILILSIGFFICAISNQIALGTHELSYHLPPVTRVLTNTFRASGRFFWPVYYLIYVGIFSVLFTHLKRRTVMILCLILFGIQVLDSTVIWKSFRNDFTHPQSWISPLQDPIWNQVAQRYRQITFVLPYNQSPHWVALAYFAAMNRMAINIGYFSRGNFTKEQEARAQITHDILNSQLNSHALYIFEDSFLWNFASHHLLSGDFRGVVNGFQLIAPQFKK